MPLLVRRLAVLSAIVLGAVRGASPSPDRPDPIPSAATPTAGDPGCQTYTAEYALAARLRLEGTPFGAGNGVYDIGPGRLKLRFYARPGPSAPARVELLSYEMREHFVVDSRVLFVHAKVTTRTDTRATPDASGLAAVGAFTGRELAWSTPVQGYRTDGTLVCEGSGCGLSGVPPSGTSPLHIGPGPVWLGKLVFDTDLGTLSMAFTRVSHTDMPKQTAFVTFAGRRMKRDCVQS